MDRGQNGLIALIGAYEPGPAPGGLRALVPLAGATLVEHQVRRAHAAGAGRILLLADALPQELSGAIRRLQEDGIMADAVERIDAAADAISGDARVLLIADACLPDAAFLQDMAAATGATVATLDDVPANVMFERIDGEARWAGTALIPGRLVAETAAMLGSWDPVSTLLRRAVQDGAARISAEPLPPALVNEAPSLAAAEARIVASARRPAEDWAERFVFQPTAELALPPLMARGVEALPLAAGAAALALLGGAIAWTGWRWAAMVLLLLAGPVAAVAERLGRISERPSRHRAALGRARAIGAALGAGGLAHGLAATSGQWGWWLVAGLAIGPAAGLAHVLRVTGRVRPQWIAGADGYAWAFLPFAVVGLWGAGLTGLAGYACVALGVAIDRIIRARGDAAGSSSA